MHHTNPWWHIRTNTDWNTTVCMLYGMSAALYVWRSAALSWRHDMETISALPVLYSPVMQSFGVFFDGKFSCINQTSANDNFEVYTAKLSKARAYFIQIDISICISGYNRNTSLIKMECKWSNCFMISFSYFSLRELMLFHWSPANKLSGK